MLVLGSLRSLSDRAPAERILAVVELPPPREPTVAAVIEDNQRQDEADRGDETLALPNGDIDISRIRARQDALFPLLTEGLPAFHPARERTSSARESLFWFVAGAPGPSGLPPLSLNDAEMDRIIDAAWSRRERWRSFAGIAALVSEHDPNTGRAAALVRGHIERNLLQPYRMTEPPDKQFWVLLELAIDQQPIIRFVERFTREHPGSRVATELLFFLDRLVEANHSTLLTLWLTDPARDLAVTRDRDRDAFDLAVAIRRQYVGLLQERQLDSPAGIQGLYDDIRARLLTTIVEATTDGYGAADARYLLGRIAWNQPRVADAMDWWRTIEPDDRGLYAPFYNRILQEIQSSSAATNARVNAILGAEHGAWMGLSAARLRQFGHTPGSF